MKRRIIAAMSGGVDSSVMAALLVEAGHDVVGVTLNVEPRQVALDNIDRVDACCSLSAVEDARRVADHIGIPHYTLNFRDVFRERVIDDFVAEYQRGRTPNPCVRCNEHIKFEGVLHRLHGLDADAVATGHFARVDRDAATGRWRLRRGVDSRKDQSYVLYPLTQNLLARTLFPLGELTKDAVRAHARRLGLITAEKPESQEICFVTNNRYGDFIARLSAAPIQPGPILDRAGRQLGEHRGIIYYTVGQRRGLNLPGPDPLYVIEIDAERNALIVGRETDLYRAGLEAEAMTWVSIAPPGAPGRAAVKIRYRAPEIGATIEALPDGRARIRFDKPQKSVTPGQAVVVYDGDVVLAGGTIARALAGDELTAGSGARCSPATSSASGAPLPAPG